MIKIKINFKYKSLFKKALVALIYLVCLCILGLALRGLPGVPNALELNTKAWKENGPLELSPERGRYVITYSLVEDRSFHFSTELARFATPDLGYWKNKFVSLFAPGVSLIIIPGYYLGKLLNASQVGTFATIAIFAFINMLLVKSISQRLGASKATSVLAGLTFLFATPAFAYAVSLYQHHISVFLLLFSLYLLIKEHTKWLDLFAIWFMCALSLMVDNPNLFMMAPIGIAAVFKIFQLDKAPLNIKLTFKPLFILSIIGVVLPAFVFGYFNYRSYGNPLQLAGTVPYAADLDENGKPVAARGTNISAEDLEELYATAEAQSTGGFFKTRNLLNGLYIHFISPDRGIIYYTPVVLLGILGFAILYVKQNKWLALLAGISGINILVYSMWGDPWGGWGFGSRYLIPTYALLSIGVGVLLSYIQQKTPQIVSIITLVIFMGIFGYSTYINTLGAITTSAVPPQIQVLELEQLSGVIQRYNYLRNIEFLNSNNTKSFVYNVWAHNYLSTWNYFYAIYGLITSLTLVVGLSSIFGAKHEK